MSAERNANATLSELLIKRVQELIIENEEKVLDIRAESGIERGTLRGTKHYRPTEQATGRLKQLKRDLGALLTTSVKDQEKLLTELDKLDLINNPGELGETLTKFLKAKEGKEIYYKVGRDMTVGHHPTATNILRDALAGPLKYDNNGRIVRGQIATTKFGQETREALIKIAKDNNYNLGDNVIAYIDPAAHKEFTTELTGLLGKRFNLKNKKDLEQFLNFQELLQRSAHARAFGGTKGIPLPPQLLSGEMDAKQIFKIAEPYLRLAKAGSAQGLDMHALLKNTDWSNPEELLKVLKTKKIPNTDVLLQDIYKSQVDNNLKPSGRLIGAFTDPSGLRDQDKKLWHALRKGVVNLENVAQGMDLEKLDALDLTKGTQIPTAKGSSVGDVAANWGDSSIFHFSDGAAVLDRPGLLSGAWRAAANADTGLTNVTKNIFDAEKVFSLTGGYKKLGKTVARDFTWGAPFLFLDEEFRKKARKVDFTKPSTVLPVVEHAAVDYVAGEAIGRTAQFGYGLLPQAVRTVIGQGASFVGKSLIAPLVKPALIATAGVVATGSFTPTARYDQITGPNAYYNHPNYTGPKPDDDEVNEEENNY